MAIGKRIISFFTFLSGDAVTKTCLIIVSFQHDIPFFFCLPEDMLVHVRIMRANCTGVMTHAVQTVCNGAHNRPLSVCTVMVETCGRTGRYRWGQIWICIRETWGRNHSVRLGNYSHPTCEHQGLNPACTGKPVHTRSLRYSIRPL